MKKTENIGAAALLLGSSILLSRILGYLREMLLAYKFGTGTTTDAFYAAFQIPDLLNYFLAGGALSIAFIPLYNKIMAKEGEKAANKLMANVLGMMGAIVVAATAVLWWKAEGLVRFQFPKFDDETTALTVQLTRIVLPAQIFFITGGIVQAVLLAHRSFQAAALAPLIYNGCTILGGWFLYPYFGIEGFAFGTLAGAVLGPFLMPLLYCRGHIPIRLKFKPTDKKFLLYLGLAAPLMLGQTLLTVDEWYERWFGALLEAGSVAQLSFARKLMLVPIAVIGQAIGAAALPMLSKLYAEGKEKEMNKALLQTLQTGLALAVLAGAAFFVVAEPAVRLVYQHGKFDAHSATVVGMLAALLAFAIPAWIIQQIAIRTFYARGDTLRPMIMGTIVCLGVIPVYMTLSDSFGVSGLALAGAIAMTVNALATLLYARHLHGAPLLKPLGQTLGSTILVAIPSASLGICAMRERAQMLPLEGWDVKMIALVDMVAAGAAFALIALPAIWLFGEEGLREYLKRLVSKAF
ncbi:MAG: murein biosynthesis integral membrane protein MurJ [Alphaproteobacteria bacterium]